MRIFLAVSVSSGALIMAGCSNSAAATIYVDNDHHGRSNGVHQFDQDGDVSLMGSDMTIRGRIGGGLSVVGSDLDVSAEIGEGMSLVGSDVVFDGSVGRDANIAGSDVEWSGSVGGDVEIAGSDVEWSGSAEGSLSIAGSDIEVDGRIGDDLDIAGSDIDVSTGSRIAGDLSIAGSDLNVFGEIAGDADLVGSSIDIEGRIDGALMAIAYSRRGWSWSSDNSHQRIRIDGAIGEGSAVCARRVTIGRDAVLANGLVVFADEAPVFENGASQTGVSYEEIDGRDCDDLLETYNR
ncbi:hypothetical protein [Hyphobacterium sp.]|uniref:hypothetical protein n=1 Tax=Hyphobacterium sp. TaxID=2004662 RepID=UPI003747B9B8